MKPKSKLMKFGWEQGMVLSWDGHGGFNQMNWVFDRNVDDELTLDWKIGTNRCCKRL